MWVAIKVLLIIACIRGVMDRMPLPDDVSAADSLIFIFLVVAPVAMAVSLAKEPFWYITEWLDKRKLRRDQMRWEIGMYRTQLDLETEKRLAAEQAAREKAEAEERRIKEAERKAFEAVKHEEERIRAAERKAYEQVMRERSTYRSPYGFSCEDDSGYGFYQPREYPGPRPGETTVSILTPAQINQLNLIRQRISLDVVKRFRQIRIQGSVFSNLVMDAGVFTAHIVRRGQADDNKDIIVMLYGQQSVKRFAEILCSIPTGEARYCGTGHLIPSKTGKFFSVLLLTEFSVNGMSVY